MSAIEAVFFDLDNTLCVHNQSDEAIHQAVFENAGVEPFFSPADARAVDPTDVETANSDAEYYANLYREAARPATGDYEPGLFTELGKVTTEVIDETDVSFRPGAVTALEYAKKHYNVGLITNGGESTQRPKLETLGITDTFDTTVFCHPVEGIEPKPASEPFEQALSDLDVLPESAVYIGDSYSSDVVGAHQMGMQSVWVPAEQPDDSLPKHTNPSPTHRLDTLSELSSLL